ncbi:hypothetical protein [Lysobacter brunescens]|uniref:Uncharacterized protein n=1 Tax=Lysobacter brunescens TaxID=262323 RepID=A0ABW2Y8Z3_9GAMM
MTTPAPPKMAAQPPSPSSMLYLIYQKDGDGALSYEVDDGAVATWWFGHSFDLGGKHWYTGFAYNTPEVYGPKDENAVPAPGSKVNITAATLFKDSAGSEKEWTIDGAYPTIGEFGAYERAGEIDKTRKIESRETGDGRMVLAVPVTFFANGVDSASYEMFLFDSADLQLEANAGRQRWTYIGNIAAGEDNDADCGQEPGDRACYQTKGTLSFGTPGDGGLPTIRIAMSGTGTEAASGVTEYRYDTAGKQYQPAP